MKKFPTWTRTPSFLIFACLALAGMAVLILNSLKLWVFTVDDAYITFRYSANLASGAGPTYNLAGQRAEGYTSVLWMVVMAFPHLLRFGEISFAKLAGILATAGTMGWMALFLWRAGPAEGRGYRLASAGVVALFFGLLPETAVHAVSGMETALYTFLLAGLMTLSYLAINGAGWALNLLPVAALLAGLARPEANLPAVLLLAAVWWNTAFGGPAEGGWTTRGRLARVRQGRGRTFLLRALALYALPGLVYFLWRWSYFGVLLPLPFYVKTGEPGLAGWPSVSAFGVFVLSNLGLYIGLGLLGERRAVGLILLAVLPDLAFFLFSSSIMNYDYRFLFPLLPLLLALAGMGLARLMEQAAGWMPRGGRMGLAPAWVGLLALAMFAGQNLPRASTLIDHKLEYARGMLRNHITIGQTLRQVKHDGASPVLVIYDSGAMAYYSGWRTIDVSSLNDPTLALKRVPVEAYLAPGSFDVMVLTSNNPQEFHTDAEYGYVLYRQAVKNGLAVVARSQFYAGDYIFVMARPGSEAAEKLQARGFHKVP